LNPFIKIFGSNNTSYKHKKVMSRIREATRNDSESINRLSQDLGYDIVSQSVAEERIKKIIESKIDYLWVFEDDNQIIGWIHIFLAQRVASASFVEIGGLVVASNYRRQGVGKRLVEYAVLWAKTRNLKIRVRCNEQRTDTQIFYESVGFSSTKTQHVFEISL